MEYYYAKPVKNRQDGTFKVMHFLCCLISAAINVISNFIISVRRIVALLIRITVNSFLTLFFINPGVRWK
jgi:hypothetical protein